MKAKAKHLIVISIDALNAKDFDFIKELPNFSNIINNGSYVREVTGVYPSVTYPSHTSIITGTYPEKHGIFNNEKMQIGVKTQEWYWQKKYIKVPTLVDIALEHGMKVGNVFWPVMGGAKIHYNCPEVWSVKPYTNQVIASLVNGTPLFLLKLILKFGTTLKGAEQPNLDDFLCKSVCYMVENKKPNLTLLHLNEIDHARHKFGFASEDVYEGLKREDRRLGEIIEASKRAGIYDETAFIVLGDHGFSDVDYKICINTAFVKKGLIHLDRKGKIVNCKVYANYCDGSNQIKVMDPQNIDEVSKLLFDMKDSGRYGIKEIYTKEEAAKKNIRGDFDFMLEAEDGYYFDNGWNEKDVIVKIKKSRSRAHEEGYFAATHGYDPLKEGYRTFFAAFGCGIKKGVTIENANLVDEGPTMAAILGLEMKNVDGIVLNDILM
ncbi:putative AlkP superfamily pyrophosphatase or phosphodiesterase [Clostridium acetobutylicum]|uniref:AP superfamily n=1 Tax=Clostridium acetobutylicum (strain ATCC 824 / DSM 792 / JCM 1419 / IAM 19013 / LMG 5710 / NBRC 13948 / NRRL B-527 / VKM B-1787 / 2291 / W) TaxID=272562 RepID=Q97LS7_CLOAB|nr:MULTISPECIES: alkaline phosphatase family protein [Clostridium]AAK78457.1 AP superfamily [Clostridium acetobutylicum ATCC 824]ADZ19527.1 AP superfamily [Clostridium acetobutylicum EA 2018]AEI31264.1 AP endonuclease [Clostridium acetobutylicum DSM 1731]AWV80179.1 alkaline phosphatase family protein [Clostridium acetobutylicum]MBC2392360.1 alkaline phosphatase family protein [Clostridium acetobutylicum]